ncbi:unnamed protein product [Albugo candida]|nr:unnamed protein product [Albugo candida]|eukprot:CCI46536.1 unnamed protein product [Albugo candida]
MGATLSATSDKAHFQHFKTIDALFAAQAIAHEDFALGANQFRTILTYQKPNGRIPHLVYGPSVPREWDWISKAATFYPGPSFWMNVSSESTREETNGSNESQRRSQFLTSTLSVPPLAADIALNIFRLAPFDTMMGSVTYKAIAIEFLCEAYDPLKRFHQFLIRDRISNRTTYGYPHTSEKLTLFIAIHPWETLSPWSQHWEPYLHQFKHRPDYDQIIHNLQIPEEVKSRFIDGSRVMISESEADIIQNYYKPMLYVAQKVTRNVSSVYDLGGVEDVEFNSFVLRSTNALVTIGNILSEHAAVCNGIITQEQLEADTRDFENLKVRLEESLLGDSMGKIGLWNETMQCYNDASNYAIDPMHPSLRNILPSFAQELPSNIKSSLFSHFLAPSGTFGFLCDQFPIPYYPCNSSTGTSGNPITLLHYNYLMHRSFTENNFFGVAEFLRNRTASMLCGFDERMNATSIGFNTQSAAEIRYIDDYGLNSSMAAAMVLNILLPAVAPFPNPAVPPVDHRMLTVIMCIELTVAFGVALGCFIFSVYFVANRPRANAYRCESSQQINLDHTDQDRVPLVESSNRDGISKSVTGNRDQRDQSFGDSGLESTPDLEESLLAEEDEQAYGSIERARRDNRKDARWESLKDAISIVSPW